MNKISPLKNVIYLFGGRGFASLFGFLATIYCAQKVGVTNFGWLSFALSLVSYALILTDFGLLTLGVRKLTQSPTEEKFPSHLLSLRLFLATLFFLFLLLLTHLLNKPLPVKKLTLVYSLFLFINSFSLEWFFQAKERMNYVGINRILISSGYLFLLLLLVKKEPDYQKVPVAFLFSQAIGTLFLLLSYKREGKPLSLTFNLPTFKNLFLTALPLGITNILQILYTYFGIILLGFIGQPEELGIYSAMHRILFSTLVIDFVASFLFLPIISSFYQTQFNKLPKLFTILNRLLLFFTLLVVLIVLIFAPSLIGFFLGRNYLPGTNILRILIFFLPFTTLSTLYATGLIAGKREKKLLFNTLVGTLTNIALSPLFYFQLNGLGIALAFVLGEFVILTLNLISVRKEIKFSLRKGLIPIITNQEIKFLTQREL
ncbi:MAG: flippase [candidate division WOR-3 bacterium]